MLDSVLTVCCVTIACFSLHCNHGCQIHRRIDESCVTFSNLFDDQALRDANTNWMACELRFDRSARCFQRFALRGLAENVGLIVGDAQNALENHLKKGLAFEGADRWGG